MRKNGMRAAAIFAAAAVLALAVGGEVAAIGTNPVNSRVTVKSKAPNTFKGLVTSERLKCVPDRGVKLFQVRLHGERSLVSQGVSNDEGVWRIALEGELTGYFYAKVKAKEIGSLICRSARSHTIHVTP
jgi:hypothetical protein